MTVAGMHIPRELDEILLENDLQPSNPGQSEHESSCATASVQGDNEQPTSMLPQDYPSRDDASASPAAGNDGEQDNQQENGSSWPESRTKTGKTRKRLALACIACRRKKIRCSGEKPACSHCFRSRIPCVYKVTPRAPAPRTDYMTMLDKRLRRMEDRVIKSIPREEYRDLNAIGRANVKPPLAGQTHRNTSKASRKRSAAQAFDVELREWTRERHVNHNGMLVNTVQECNEETTLLTEGAEQLPSAEIQEHLSEVYFDSVYGQSYLLLHKPSFMRKLKAGMVPPVLMLAICAISARFSNHPQMNTEPAFLRGEDWAVAAGKIALNRHDRPSITMVTVFLLLGLHEFGTCHGGRSWSFGGQALKMAYALQLHRELEYDPVGKELCSAGDESEPHAVPLSFTDREIRRRTMWACLLMDRFVSSGGYRPPLANTDFVQIQLPIKEANFQMEIPGSTESLEGKVLHSVPEDCGQVTNAKDNMGVSAYLIRSVILWGLAIDYMNSGQQRHDSTPIWTPESEHGKLKKKVQDFITTLPDNLRFTSENIQIHATQNIANQLVYLHVIIHQTLLFLNGFAIPVTPGSRRPHDIPQSYLAESSRAAVEAASQISSLLDQASEHNLTAPFAGYSAYTAGIIHIWRMFCNQDPESQGVSKENLRHTYRYLNKMKRYWGSFHYLIDTTKERYRQFADAALRGALPDIETDVHKVAQYGEWFDQYPQGVSQKDWSDPQNKQRSESGENAVMSHQSDLKSVEDFFASLSPNIAEDGSRKEPKRNASTTAAAGGRASAGGASFTSQTAGWNSGSSRSRPMPGIPLEIRTVQNPYKSVNDNVVPEPHPPLPDQQNDQARPAGASTNFMSTEFDFPSGIIFDGFSHIDLDNASTALANLPIRQEGLHDLSIKHPETYGYLSLLTSSNPHAEQQGGQPHQQQKQHGEGHPEAWNAPFNNEASGMLDWFFEPGGWFQPFNIPSQTPQAAPAMPSAFPQPSHAETSIAPPPIPIQEPGGDPHSRLDQVD